jgi:DNA-3-methyladenine glycosylase
MFGQVGIAYVYFTYGMHYCVNAVARSSSYDAGAVLIRGIQPEKGIEAMFKNRGMKTLSNLTNGPAKLTQAMQISKKQYGEDLSTTSSLYITEGIKIKKITSSPRIGIKNGNDKLWNFKMRI